MCRWGILAVVLGGSSCTRVSDADRFPGREEALYVHRTIPIHGARNVPPTTQIDLCFSTLLDPRNVAPVDATVSSGNTLVDTELALQLWPWRGPGGSAPDPTGPWCQGSVLSIQPRAPLVAGLLYRLRLVPRARGWAGERLDTEATGWTREGKVFRYTVEFTVDSGSATQTDSGSSDSSTADSRSADSGSADSSTSDSSTSDSGTSDSSTSDSSTSDSSTSDSDTADSGPTETADGGAGVDPEEPPPPTRVLAFRDLYTAGQIFDPARTTCGCHRDPSHLASARLDLTDPQTAYRALVVNPRPRDTGFPMVSPRRPSESFLIHKLLRDRDGHALHKVLGDPMPPDEAIPYEDYVTIARWIEDGALP